MVISATIFVIIWMFLWLIGLECLMFSCLTWLEFFFHVDDFMVIFQE